MSFEPAAASGPFALHINSTPDAIGWLPERAKERLVTLRQHVSDLRNLIPPFEQRNEAANEKVAAEGVLRRLQAHRSAGGFELGHDDERVIHARERLDRLTDELQRLNDLDQTRTQTWQAASQVQSRCETWLRDGRPGNTVLRDHETEVPQLLKGEDLMAGIARLQRRGRELKSDLHAIRSAKYPASYCKQRAREQIEQLAARGAVSVSRLVERDGDIEWPTQMLRVTVANAQPGATGFLETLDAAAVLAWTLKDALIARLDREIANEADDATALSHAEREKRESVVMADLLAVERDEAALTWQALEQRLPVFHRNDCSPLAILQCELVAAPQASASRTSPELVLRRW